MEPVGGSPREANQPVTEHIMIGSTDVMMKEPYFVKHACQRPSGVCTT
jgi:hypothetical protein